MNTTEFIEKIKQHLKSTLSTSRFIHVQGVAKTACELAAKHGVNTSKAEIAGWLHDVAKEFKNEELIERAEKAGFVLIDEERDSPHLLHAKVGALVAKELFEIEDPEILGAIAQHTLGKPNMSKLEEIIFISDAIEPSRPQSWKQAILFALDEKGLDSAIVTCCQQSIKEVLARKITVHPLTINTYNYYLNKANKGI